jgi:hypothetical protein
MRLVRLLHILSISLMLEIHLNDHGVFMVILHLCLMAPPFIGDKFDVPNLGSRTNLDPHFILRVLSHTTTKDLDIK